MSISKLAVSISLMGLLFVGVLLLTNHPGMAERITSYIFSVLMFGAIYAIISKS